MKNNFLLTVAAVALVTSSITSAAVPQKKSAATKNAIVSSLSERTKALESEVRSMREQIDLLQNAPAPKENESMKIGTLAEMYAHGPALVTSPALGVRRSADDASDLTVSLSSVNEDMTLLEIRQRMDNYATDHGIPIPQRPIISVSGGAEGQLIYTDDFSSNTAPGVAKKTFDVDFTRAELDVIGEASPWATAALIIAYDNLQDPYKSLSRVKNSRLQLSRGFMTLGNLNKFPLYLTLGQVYSPFGNYGSYMVTIPVTQTLGRIKQRQVILGYDYSGVYAQVYGFQGETRVAGNNEFLKRGGANLGYKFSQDDFSMNVSAGITGNLAESDGMQSSSVFGSGFPGAEALNTRVPAVNGRAKIGLKPFNLIGEYVGAIKDFDSQDLSYNGGGAKPQALELEAAVDFKIADKPNTFAIGYGRTWQALALKLPQQDFFAEYNVSLIKDTIESIEYRHDFNYGSDDYGSVKGLSFVVPTGKHRNIITAQLGIYF